jgi:hypothetical protein
MKNFISQISNKHFYYAKFIAEIAIDDALYNEYRKLNEAQRRLIRLVRFFEKKGEKNKKKRCQLIVTIPHLRRLEEISITRFKEVSNFFEEKIKEPMSFFTRISFHYPLTVFCTDPILPIELEEKQKGLGKVILAGLRIRFPEHKEIKSVILDIQNCSHCKTEDIFIEILSSSTHAYNFGYFADIIKKSNLFSSYFVKQKEPKNDKE